MILIVPLFLLKQTHKKSTIVSIFITFHEGIPCRKRHLEGNDIWEEFYEDSFRNKKTKCQNCEIKSGETQYYLDECLFSDEKDKIINFDASYNSKLFHNYCEFYNCSSPGNGGSIFTESQDCSIVQRRFCAIDSFSNPTDNENCYGLFSYVFVGDNCLNYILESTLFGCGKPGTDTNALTFQENGNISLSKTNYTS